MDPYDVIAVVIFVLGCVSSYGFIRWRQTGKRPYLDLGLGAMALEVEARKARDRQRIKDRNRPKT